MAKVLTEMPRATRTGARKYEWDDILDGTPREYEAGEDFDATLDSFISMARQAATDRGLRVKAVKVSEDSVAIVSLPVEDDAADEDDTV